MSRIVCVFHFCFVLFCFFVASDLKRFWFVNYFMVVVQCVTFLVVSCFFFAAAAAAAAAVVVVIVVLVSLWELLVLV